MSNGDTTVTKVKSAFSPKGEMGQKYLASGKKLSMRLWEDEPVGVQKEPAARDYETVGFAIKGKARLDLAGQTILIEAGDSWVVPAGAQHTYEILETFSAVEATCPPAASHGRDAPHQEKAS